MFKDYFDIELYIKPKQGWEKLAQKNFTIKELYLKIVIFFAAIPALGHFLGFTVLKSQYVEAINKFLELAKQDPQQSQQNIQYMEALRNALIDNDITKELMIALVTYGFELFKPIVLMGIILFLAGAFGGEKDPNKAFMVAVYSLIPTWVVGIVYMMNSPLSMFLIFLASFYSFYLMFIGGEKVLKVPSGTKSFQFIIVTILLYLFISGAIGMLESNITFALLTR